MKALGKAQMPIPNSIVGRRLRQSGRIGIPICEGRWVIQKGRKRDEKGTKKGRKGWRKKSRHISLIRQCLPTTLDFLCRLI